MPTTWTSALDSYSYPVNLRDCKQAHEFPGFFGWTIAGDRVSTINFEDYFRTRAREAVEPWLEMVFWKLFSQRNRRDMTTQTVASNFQSRGISARSLWDACAGYVAEPTRESFELFRSHFGFSSQAIAVAATFPAFLAPDRYPMVDTRIAKWVGCCMSLQNAADSRGPQLIRPLYLDNKSKVLTMNDFGFVQAWTQWCVHTATKLREVTSMKWRARDVEMAVFEAWGRRGDCHPNLRLNPLPEA